MDPATITMDSSPDAERRLVEQWRGMTTDRKLAVAIQMSQTVRSLALAGVRSRHPDATPREHLLRLAVVMHGLELALAAYPEIASLDLL